MSGTSLQLPRSPANSYFAVVLHSSHCILPNPSREEIVEIARGRRKDYFSTKDALRAVGAATAKRFKLAGWSVRFWRGYNLYLRICASPPREVDRDLAERVRLYAVAVMARRLRRAGFPEEAAKFAA